MEKARPTPTPSTPSAGTRNQRLIANQLYIHLRLALVVDWPGLHTGKTLLRGKRQLQGVWINRTAECLARIQRKEISEADIREPETVPLAKLPCWAHLSWTEYRRRVQDLVIEIEAEAALERRLQNRQVVGAWRLKKRSPRHQPKKSKKSFAPQFHAGSRKARIEMYQAYGEFLGEYREAADLLKKGKRNVPFPKGCFPPNLPYVGPTGVPPDPG